MKDAKGMNDGARALSYLLAGPALYGGLGYLLDRFLGTNFVVAIGILLGACLGVYLVIKTFGKAPVDVTKEDVR